MRTVRATRYVMPLREGGSMPALVEADDDGLYVVKLRGAGQGAKALVAEVVAGELARALGLRVPEIVLVDVDPDLVRAEPDPEVRDLVRASGGLNAGLDFLPGALAYLPGAGEPPDPELAADVVWFDALVTNVDRTPRNPNILRWHGRLWLIDHGAALFRHHGRWDPEPDSRRPFPQIADHVLLGLAGPLDEADARLAGLAAGAVEGAVSAVPDDWLGAGAGRAAYAEHLRARLREPRAFVAEAEQARLGETPDGRGSGEEAGRAAREAPPQPRGSGEESGRARA